MPTYECSICEYSTKIKTQYMRHLNTNKHKKKYIEIETINTINKKKVYSPAQTSTNPKNHQHKPAQNQHKPAQIPKMTSTTPAQNQHKPAQTSTNILFCQNCQKSFKSKDNLTRHMRKYCKRQTSESEIKNNEAELLKDLLLEQKEQFDVERKELYKQIEKLLDKVGNTTNIQSNIKNTIHLNSYGSEDMSHITDKLKNDLIKIPFAMIPKMIEEVHFNDNKPENKNISLSNMRDNKIKIFSDNKWVYKDKDETISDLVDGKYYLLDSHYKVQEESKNLEEGDKTRFVNFKEYLHADDKEFVTKLKKQCELVLLNNR
jgi:hypothetical protein